MSSTGRLRLLRYGLIIGAVCALVGCDTGRNHHLKQLAKQGIEPSGRALLEAVGSGETDHIEWLLHAQVHTEQRDAHGRTPLRIALERRDLATVFRLLDAGADVNSATPDGVSVLGVALALRETAVAVKMLQNGADTHGRTPDGEKILPLAIRDGHLAVIRALESNAIDPHQTDRLGNSLLHIAIQSRQLEVAQKLIRIGADPAMRNDLGETTLHFALQQGWAEFLPELASAGADPNAAPRHALTLLEEAVREEDPEKVKLLLKIGANPNHSSGNDLSESPFVSSLKKRNLPLIATFLHAGAKPPDGEWLPWIDEAFKNRDLPLARLLLSQGACQPLSSRKHERLMESAVTTRDASFVRLFTNYGLPSGSSLHIAASKGDAEITSLLLEAGLDPNETRAPHLDTPLAAAVRKGHDRTAHLLLQHGATPGWRLHEGQSLFHLAVVTGCHQTVKHLLKEGIDPNSHLSHPVSPAFIRHVRPGVMRWILRNDRNVTPLMIAADSGNLAVTRHLLAAGAKKSVWTRSSRLWPINFASRRNDVKMMRLILGRDPNREERHIVVKIGEQKAWLYDGEGNEVFSTRVSTGKKGKATPTGEFVITNKHRTWTSTIYDSSMPFFQRLSCSDFGLHQGYVPGYPASSGCIRIPAGNAAKLFALTQAGDRVRIEQ